MSVIYLFLMIAIIYVQLMNLRFIEIIRSNTLYVNWRIEEDRKFK